MLGGIRTRLLGLVVAAVGPFTALVGGGLFSQWKGDQAQAFKSALDEARLLAVQVDDEVGNLELLLAGPGPGRSHPVGKTPNHKAIFRFVRGERPGYSSQIFPG